MGNLINPVSSRLGYTRYWNSIWSSSKINYSLTLNENIFTTKYLDVLVNLFNKNSNNMGNKKRKRKKLVTIDSYKIVKSNQENYFLFYLQFEPKEPFNKFLNRFLLYKTKKAFTLRNFITSGAEFERNRVNKEKNVYVERKLKGIAKINQRFLKYSDNNISAIRREKKLLDNINNFSHVSNSRNYKEYYKKTKKLMKYNFRRHQNYTHSNFAKAISLIKLQKKAIFYKKLLDLKEYVNGSFFKMKKNLFFRYIYDYTRISHIRFFFSLALRKYLGNINLKFLFVPVTGSSVPAANTITQYFTERLKNNKMRLSTLVNIFLRQMKRQIYDAKILGFKLICSGRFERRGRASYVWKSIGKIPNTNNEIQLDYSLRLVVLTNSICAIKVWIARSSQVKKLRIK